MSKKQGAINMFVKEVLEREVKHIQEKVKSIKESIVSAENEVAKYKKYLESLEANEKEITNHLKGLLFAEKLKVSPTINLNIESKEDTISETIKELKKVLGPDYQNVMNIFAR